MVTKMVANQRPRADIERVATARATGFHYTNQDLSGQKKGSERPSTNFDCGALNLSSHLRASGPARGEGRDGTCCRLQCRGGCDTPSCTSKASNRSNNSALR